MFSCDGDLGCWVIVLPEHSRIASRKPSLKNVNIMHQAQLTFASKMFGWTPSYIIPSPGNQNIQSSSFQMKERHYLLCLLRTFRPTHRSKCMLPFTPIYILATENTTTKYRNTTGETNNYSKLTLVDEDPTFRMMGLIHKRLIRLKFNPK